MLEGFTLLAKSLDDLASDILSTKMFFQPLVPKAVTRGLLEAPAKIYYSGFGISVVFFVFPYYYELMNHRC